MERSFRKRLVIGQASILLVLASAVATAVLAVRSVDQHTAQTTARLVSGAQWALLIAAILGALSTIGVAVSTSRLLARHRARARRAEVEAERTVAAHKEILAASDDLRVLLETIVDRCARLRAKNWRDDADRREIEAIETSARGVTRRMGEFLEVTAIQTGKVSLERASCDAASLVDQAIDHHRDTARDRGIRLRSEVQNGTAVCADPERVGRVLTTLLGEAIALTRIGAEIFVSAIPSQEGVRFAIIDVSPPLPGPIGRSYRPTAAALSDQLELLLCKRVIEAHGGHLGIEAAATGRTYWFTLPTEPSLLR